MSIIFCMEKFRISLLKFMLDEKMASEIVVKNTLFENVFIPISWKSHVLFLRYSLLES